MKRSLVVAMVGATGACVLALLSACAEDGAPTAESSMPEDAPIPSAPEPGANPEVEAGPCADCEYFPETCSPDVLCQNGPFKPSRSPDDVDTFDLRTQINVIVGRGMTDVWAAGTVGTLAHFDGTSWKRSGPDTTESLQGLRLFDSGELVFGAKMHRVYLNGIDIPDGGTNTSDGGWTSAQALPTPPAYNTAQDFDFRSAWTAPGAQWTWCGLLNVTPLSSSTNGLWRVRRRSDASFEIQPGTVCSSPCDSDGIASIHGSSADVAWAVGSKGRAFRITGADGDSPSSSAFNSLTWNQLNAVWAASDSEAWAVGVTGTIRRYLADSATAEIVTGIPANVNLRAVWGSSSSDIWAAGDAGVVLHYDGKTWARVKIAGLGARRPDLTAVWMPAPGHVWIGGQGVILSLGGQP
ncbi:MAG: hypothetical protein J0I07_15330 [Myxococcales bacterium]|nr:hypothetical protein [Myxococcales bacterium]